MSPSPSEIRSSRITKLLEYGREKDLSKKWFNMYDRLFTKAAELWPTVARPTLQSYARAAHKILMAERNQ